MSLSGTFRTDEISGGASSLPNVSMTSICAPKTSLSRFAIFSLSSLRSRNVELRNICTSVASCAMVASIGTPTSRRPTVVLPWFARGKPISVILFLLCPVRPSRSQLASAAHQHPFLVVDGGYVPASRLSGRNRQAQVGAGTISNGAADLSGQLQGLWSSSPNATLRRHAIERFRSSSKIVPDSWSNSQITIGVRRCSALRFRFFEAEEVNVTALIASNDQL